MTSQRDVIKETTESDIQYWLYQLNSFGF